MTQLGIAPPPTQRERKQIPTLHERNFSSFPPALNAKLAPAVRRLKKSVDDRDSRRRTCVAK